MSVEVYREPYKLPAGILAVVVHGAFFALLYFGFSWQSEPPVAVSVELWQSLPSVSPAKPKIEVKPEIEEEAPPPKPQEPVEPDIALPEKKKVDEKKPLPKPKPAEPSAEEQEAARERAERAAATGRVVDEYTARIVAKIRRNIVMPPDVADDARAEFLVTLLPGGSILNARLQKSSGNAAYDGAVERAILKSQPLPLPADVGMFNRFRELRLGFRPRE
ncbi:MAG: cell envelope integrity protein TolA [Gallionella sp.]|nr:cell envelope integrity protein TolA [Gallionella sp.]